MLPDGFEWRADKLWFNGKAVALCAEIPEGRCRVELRVNRIGHRVTFRPSMASGRAYVEAWAAKWEAELRRAYTAADAAS